MDYKDVLQCKIGRSVESAEGGKSLVDKNQIKRRRMDRKWLTLCNVMQCTDIDTDAAANGSVLIPTGSYFWAHVVTRVTF